MQSLGFGMRVFLPARLLLSYIAYENFFVCDSPVYKFCGMLAIRSREYWTI